MKQPKGRKRSPETEVRWLKREVKVQDARIVALLRELDERRRIGAMMSNICFNLSDRQVIDFGERGILRSCRVAWDGIKRDGR